MTTKALFCACLPLLAAPLLHAQNFTFTTLAGSAGNGSADGFATSARFNSPTSAVVDAATNIYVADFANNTIRKITSSGIVSTLAGLEGMADSTDGTGGAARFSGPVGVALDRSNNLFVTDFHNNTIRQITPGGVVSTFAGSPGAAGTNDGIGNAARFSGPYGLAVDGSNNLYVADAFNDTIRLITPAGIVSTIAGAGGSTGTNNGAGGLARFNTPTGVTLDASNNLYVADFFNHTIRRVTPAGIVTTLAGLGGVAGTNNGTGSAARFNQPAGVAVDGAGNVYVADFTNHVIRKITAAGVVSTSAGPITVSGNRYGTTSAARFYFPNSYALDTATNIYVADNANGTIRKISPASVVTTLAGRASGGTNNGTGSAASFNGPTSVAVDRYRNLYVADLNNDIIRKITPAGLVSTLAGLAGSPGSA